MVNKYANPEIILAFAYRSSQSQPTHGTRGRECCVDVVGYDVNISVNMCMATLNIEHEEI